MRITINLLPKKSGNNLFIVPELNSYDLRIFHLLLTSVNQFDSKPLPYCRWEVFYNGHVQHRKLTTLLLSIENEVTERGIDDVGKDMPSILLNLY